jgi:competence CoiA-like predicted nuclease
VKLTEVPADYYCPVCGSVLRIKEQAGDKVILHCTNKTEVVCEIRDDRVLFEVELRTIEVPIKY